MNRENTDTISVKLHLAIIEKLEKIGEELGMSRSEVARRIITKAIAAGSLQDVAPDIYWCIREWWSKEFHDDPEVFYGVKMRASAMGQTFSRRLYEFLRMGLEQGLL